MTLQRLQEGGRIGAGVDDRVPHQMDVGGHSVVAADGVVEGGVVGDHDGHVDGGEEDEKVPAGLGDTVVRENPAGLFGHGRFVLGQRLNVRRRGA